MKKLIKLFAFSLIIIASLFTFATAQSFKATVVGKVTDSAGAVVPGAAVTITREATNFSQTATTNESGEYVLPQLDPGSYTIKIEFTGFKTALNSNVVLETQQSLRYDVALEAGSISETVTVEDVPSALNTETSSKGEVITPRQVQDLPLNGRNFTDLALLTPGVYRRPADDDQGEGLATAGTRTDATNFILDGVVNKSDRNGSVGVNTSVDSIREFKVETSTYTAEFGRNAGAQINVVSKTGSNRFSGTLFDYVRNDAFDARNALAVDIVGTEEDEGAKTLRRHQFGGTIGGPMPFFNFGEGGPTFTKGRDRTFFFVSYEGTRETRSKTAFTTAPRANWLQGDFRDILGAGPDFVLGTDDDVPNSNRIGCLRLNSSNPNLATKVDCPTLNVIPMTNTVVGSNTILGFNPLSVEIMSRIPTANVITPLTPFGYAITLLGETNRDQFTAKVDHKVNEQNNASFRYSSQTGNGYDPFPSARNFWPTFGRDQTQNQKNIAFSDTHVFSSKIINEARFGIYSQHNENLGENRDIDYLTEFGIPGLPTGTEAAFQGYPAIRIDGFSEFGDRPNDPFIYDLQNLQFYDAVNAVIGNHSFKFGVDIIRSNYNEADVRNVRGDFRFRGRNSNCCPASNNAVSGPGSFADFLYGLPDSTQRQIGADPADLTGWQYAFFVQDNWRVSDWLTLNLGLRYELQTALTEANNRLTNFIPELGTSVISGDPRYPRGLISADKNNFGPRFGFAMRPFRNDKTVIRGGGGIYYSLETFNPIRQQLAVSFPFIQRETWNRVSSQLLRLTFQNPFDGTGGIQGVTTPFGLQTDYSTPEIYQYNLTIERELLKDLALEIGYVGSQGRFLGIRYNLNANYPNGTINPTTGLPNGTRRYPALGDIQYQEQIAKSSYNALQTSLRRRSKGGLTLLASYTFSKAMDTASSTNNSSLGTQKFPQDIHNLAAERALSDFHRTHQFSASFNYELPIGRGRMFLGDAKGLTDFLLGGWQLNGIISLLSGRPFTPQYSTGDVAQQRPDLVGDPYANIPDGLTFNPAAFDEPVATAASPEVFGNAGRNILIGPNFQSVDFSLMKNFKVTERAKVQFRAEVFNIFNHPNFQVPVFLLDSSNVGQYSLTAGENREMQFALKLIF